MVQNVQDMARRVWHVVRVAFVVLRKNFTKRKLLLDLKYLTLKRSKLAGKTLAGKLIHLHNHHPPGGAYEFSCTNTPNHFLFPLPSINKTRAHHNSLSHTPTYANTESEIDAVNKVLEMMISMGNNPNHDIEASPYPYSPVLPGFGFGRSPAVRQLRVTDSPYPLMDGEVGNFRVDEAAEEFIQRFYSQLSQQRITDA